MAPRRFTFFSKLPVELRLRIWALTVRHGRLIRAKWENHIIADSNAAIYRLSAGPVPPLLIICAESRFEAQKHYSLIRSRLPMTTLTKQGERLLHSSFLAIFAPNITREAEERAERREASKKAKGKKKEPRIWVNFAIDTLYFVNLPASPQLLSWCRRITNPKIGGLHPSNPLKHIALAAHFTLRLVEVQRMETIYELCMQHPSLESITIMLDNSKFEKEKRPDVYNMKEVVKYTEGMKGGGRWGKASVRGKIQRAVEGLFVDGGDEGVKDVGKWRAWRSERENWQAPEIRYMGLSKGR